MTVIDRKYQLQQILLDPPTLACDVIWAYLLRLTLFGTGVVCGTPVCPAGTVVAGRPIKPPTVELSFVHPAEMFAFMAATFIPRIASQHIHSRYTKDKLLFLWLDWPSAVIVEVNINSRMQQSFQKARQQHAAFVKKDLEGSNAENVVAAETTVLLFYLPVLVWRVAELFGWLRQAPLTSSLPLVNLLHSA